MPSSNTTSHRWPALMDRETAAEYLGISPRNLSSLVASQKIATVLIGARSIRFPKERLDEWIDSLPSGQTSKQKLERRPGGGKYLTG